MAADGLCDVPGFKTVCTVTSGVSSAIGFANDPLGYIAQKMGSAASGLVTVVLPAVEELTHPDLGQKWFINAYEFTFALAIFVFVLFLGNLFVQRSRRQVSGDEMIETLTFYVPAFFIGVVFGPLIGTAILSFTGALTDVVVSSQLTPSVDQTIATLNSTINGGDPATITGGSIIAIVFFAFLILALLIVFVALLVMLVALYLTGAIFPLSLVWLVNPANRQRGYKIISVWIGVCFSHVLVFLMLGLAFRIVSSAGQEINGDPSVLELANLAVATIALFMAGLSPLALLKFAPIGPSVGGSRGAPSVSIPSQRSGGSGAPSATDSQTAQLARSTPSSSETASGGGAGGGVAAESAAGAATGAAAGGGLLGLLDRAQSGGQSAEGSGVGGEGSPTSAAGSAMETPSLESAEPGSGGASPSGGISQLAGAAGGGPAGSGAGGAAGGSAAASAGGAAASAGAAEGAAAATGVGLPLAAGIAVAKGVTSKVQSLGDMAGEHMEHGEQGGN